MIDVFINSRNKIFGPLFKLYFPAIKYYKTTYVHETMKLNTKICFYWIVISLYILKRCGIVEIFLKEKIARESPEENEGTLQK